MIREESSHDRGEKAYAKGLKDKFFNTSEAFKQVL